MLRQLQDPNVVVAGIKTDLTAVLHRAAVLIPEEDVVWLVEQVYALNRAHAGPSVHGGMSP